MQRIAHYDLIEVLGDGGMGTVWKARDPRFDRLVAIKLLHPHLVRSPGVIERFKMEAVIQAKLQHPHIVNVYDFVHEGDVAAIVMEHVEGQALDAVIAGRHGQSLPVPWCVEIMEQVLAAMGAAHDQGLVHRDLKPSNILVRSLSTGPHAKVTDFGIARVVGSERLRTATGATMGTLSYMSPEHVRSPKYVDARSDIYALGVVLFELVTGHLPHEADTEFELMAQIVSTPAKRAIMVAPGIPRALDAVIQRALAKEPADRFQDCDAMRRALGAVKESAAAPPAMAPPRAAPAGPDPSPPPLPLAPPHPAIRRGRTMPDRWLGVLAASVLVSSIGLLVLFGRHDDGGAPAASREGLEPVRQGFQPPSASGSPATGAGAKLEEPPQRPREVPPPAPEAAPGRDAPREAAQQVELEPAVQQTAVQQAAAPEQPAADITAREVRELWDAMSSAAARSDPAAFVAGYGESVRYFNAGIVGRDFIRLDKQAYFRAWPRLTYSLAGEVSMSAEPDGSLVVHLPVRFVAENLQRQKRRSGLTDLTWKLRRVGGQARIVEETEHVISRDAPGG